MNQILLAIVLSLAAVAYCDVMGIVSKGPVSYMSCLKRSFSIMSFLGSGYQGNVNMDGLKSFKAAIDAGVKVVNLYINPCKECEDKQQINDLCKALNDMGYMSPIYIQIDPDYFFTTASDNIRMLRSIISAIVSEKKCFDRTYHIYASKYNWIKVFGEDYNVEDDVYLRWVYLDNIPSRLVGWSKFGGWSIPDEKVYNWDATACDNSNLRLMTGSSSAATGRRVVQNSTANATA